MAALDFPSSPTLGQIYSANGVTYVWSGTTWQAKNNAYTGSQGDLGYTGSAGINGYTGSSGIGFNIAKQYGNVALLEADTSPTNIVAGEFALINTGNVDNSENSRLYIWDGNTYTYVNDLSGAAGITGPSGYTGSQGVWADLGAISANLVPSANVTYDLGSATNRWRDLYLSGNTIDLGGATISTDSSGFKFSSTSGNVDFNSNTISYLNTVSTTGLSTGPSVQAIASGNLANGDRVVINSDGTVSVANEEITTIPADLGTTYTFNSGSHSLTFVAFDPNDTNTLLVGYRDLANSQYGTVVVGTVNGSVISFGAEYTFGVVGVVSFAFDPNTAGKFVAAYYDSNNSGYGTAVVGNISGNEVTFGTPVVFNSASTSAGNQIAFDANTPNTFVVVYQDTTTTFGRAVVGTISGTVITFGTTYVFNSFETTNIGMAFDPNTAGRFVVAFQDYENSRHGMAIVGSISGTVITFSTKYQFDSIRASNNKVKFDPNTADKFLIVWRNFYGYGDSVVGTLSGTAITFGTPTVWNTGSTDYADFAFDPGTPGAFVVVCRDNDNTFFGALIHGQISGYDISYTTKYTFQQYATENAVVFDPTTPGKFILAYYSADGKALVGTAEIVDTIVTNVTADNYLGISDGVYANTSVATIQVSGSVNNAQTGLTAGKRYYLQTDGNLALTPDSPSVFAGTALSANSILIGGASIGADAEETLSNKTFLDCYDTVYTLTGNVIDPANGGIQTKTISSDVTITSTIANGQSVVMMLNGGDTYTVTWPTMSWVTSSGNTAPTLTSSDTVVLWAVSSTLYGAYVGSYA